MRRVIVLTTMLLVMSACSSVEPEVISDPDSTDAPTSSESSGSESTDDSTSTTTTITDASNGLPDGVVQSGSSVAMGTAVRVVGFDDEILDVTLAEVVDPATPGLFSEPTTGSRLIGLRLMVTNAGDTVWSDSPSNAISVIADDNTQHTSAFASIEEGTGFADTTTSPGDFRQGWVVVELPDGASMSRVRYTPNSGFADDFAEWDMSLGTVEVAVAHAVTVPDATVGDTITLMDFDDIPVAMTVNAVVDPAEPGDFSDPQDGSRLVAVQLTLTNEGSVNYEDSVGNIAAVITSEGYSFSTTFSDTKAGPGFEGSVVLTPGDVRTGWIVFEVPIDLEVVKITAALNSGFGPEVGEWNLIIGG
jgi:hypothetical protein